MKDIFLNNPELMLELRHVISGQNNMMSSSAFMAPTGQPPHFTPGSMQVNHQVPNAYQSTATHFSPIVVNANGQQQLNKPQVKTNDSLYSSANDHKISRKMKELKRNLMKTRAPLTIAKDVEEDANQERTGVPIANHVSPNMQQGPHVGASLAHQPHQQNFVNQGLMNSTQGLVNGQLQGQMGMQGQNTNNMGMGGSSPSGIFPFQVQLQPDPRTGFFQLIPVAVQPQQQQPSQQPQLVTQQVPQNVPQQSYGVSQQPTQSMQTQNSVPQQKSLSPAEELANQLQKESEDRRRYLKYTQELRARVKNENMEYQESHRSKPSSSSSRSGERKSESRAKSRTNKDKEDRRRSHTISTSDVKDDLARATNNVRNRVKESRHHSHNSQSQGSNLKKASSEENILDKVEKSNGYTSRSHRSEDMRTRLKRAKSGSSLDYKNMEVRVKDIQIDDTNSSSHFSTRHQRNVNRDSSSAHLSKSQPHLDLDLPQDDVRRQRGGDTHRRSRNNHGGDDNHVRSPLGEGAASPPPSPSLSKDSGVSGLNMKASGEMTLMERLLNADTLRHQQRLSKVICLLRDEFAFDGYMENGVEDFAMGKS